MKEGSLRKAITRLLAAITLVSYGALASQRPPLFTDASASDADREAITKASSNREVHFVSLDSDAIRRGEGLSFSLNGRHFDVDFDSVANIGFSEVWRGTLPGNRGKVELSRSNGVVSGQVQIGRRTYLIVPINGDHVLIEDDGDHQSRRELLANFKPSEERAYARHRQLASLDSGANLKVGKRTNHVYWIMDTVLGSVGNNRKVAFNDRAKDILMLTGAETFEVVSDMGGPDGHRIYVVSERINGIRVDVPIRLLVSENGGQIVGVINSVLTARDLPELEPEDATSNEAKHIAIESTRAAYQTTTLKDVKSGSSELVYRVTDSDVIELAWKVEFTHNTVEQLVYVDAKTRRAELVDQFHFDTKVCLQNAMGDPATSCNPPPISPPPSFVIIDEQGNCQNGFDCTGQQLGIDANAARIAMNDLQDEWAALFPSDYPFLSPNLELIVAAKLQSCGANTPPTVIACAGGRTVKMISTITEDMTDLAIIAHEMTHLVFSKLNNTLLSNTTIGARSSP